MVLWPLSVVIHFFLFATRRLPGRIFKQKIGFVSGDSRCPVTWVHLSSLGEFQTALPFLKRFKEKFKTPILLTYFNSDLAAVAARHPLVDHLLALPVENILGYRRIVEWYRVREVLFFETEIWPILLLFLRSRRIKTYLMYGYLNESAFRRYRYFHWLFRGSFRAYTRICARSDEDKQHFEALGIDPAIIVITGDLKCDIALPRLGRSDLQAWPPPADVFLIVLGSIHRGEIEPLLDALRILIDTPPKLPRGKSRIKAAIVPRYIEIAERIKKESSRRKLGCHFYSDHPPLPGGADILIVDVYGVLRDIYAICDLAFVGGSLLPLGGQNLLEPIAYNKRTITGPHFFHFSHIVDRFRKYIEISSALDLPEVFSRCVESPRRDNGRDLLKSLAGASKRMIDAMAKVRD